MRAAVAVLGQARLGIVGQHPSPARILRRRLGAADHPQPSFGVELVDVDAAEQVFRRLAAHVDEIGPLAHPGAAAARELELRVAAEDLELARVLVGGRGEVLADHPQERGHDEARESRGDGDAATDTPAARMTVSSLSRARPPSPMIPPISAPIGSIW